MVCIIHRLCAVPHAEQLMGQRDSDNDLLSGKTQLATKPLFMGMLWGPETYTVHFFQPRFHLRWVGSESWDVFQQRWRRCVKSVLKIWAENPVTAEISRMIRPHLHLQRQYCECELQGCANSDAIKLTLFNCPSTRRCTTCHPEEFWKIISSGNFLKLE